MADQKYSFMITDNILIGKQIGCAGLDKLNIGKLILNTLKSNSSHVAQVDAETERKITFEEIRERSVRLAIWMKTEGVYPGDLIGICTEHHVGLYALFACLYIGAIPIVRKYDKRTDFDASGDLTRANPKIIFINKLPHAEPEPTDTKSDMLTAPSMIVFDSSQFLHKKFCFTYNFLAAHLEKFYDKTMIDKFTCTQLNRFRLQTAMIIYTRGINGLAKPVKISHKAILAPVNQEMIAMLSGTVGMWIGPYSLFPNMLLAIHSILAYKRTIIFKENNIIKLWQAIEKYKVNWVRLETNLCQAILNSKNYLTCDASSLKTLIFSGSRMEHYFYADLNALLPETSIVSLYGTIETGIIAFQRYSGKPGSSGHIGRNICLKITDSSGTPLNSNIPGKIWCKCWGMSNKYYDINSTVPIEMTIDNGWYDTGDIGYYDDDGDIYVISRVMDLIHFKEFYFSATIIEDLIKKQPGVDEVAVVAKPCDTNGEVPVAFITAKTGEQVKEQEIINITANKLRDYMKLRGGVILLNEMPYGFYGNIDRHNLRLQI